MSGKAYTLSEMKIIVDYLVENKAYGETKGRKMWVNFENSTLTNRTWQSLKETFLKRILPDICNPYYKLSREQIHSFKQGTNMAEKDKNKLEIQSEIHFVSDDSSGNGENPKNCDKPSTSKANAEEDASGETIKGSKILSRDRSSVDTVIIDRCYETADEVRKALESPTDKQTTNEDQETTASSCLSFKNMITFSEPLTPMLQEVLHDFASDDSNDSEPRMQIVENEQISDEGSDILTPQVPLVGNINSTPEQNNIQDKSENGDNLNPPKIKSLRLKKKQADNKATENWGVVDSTTNNLEPNTTEKQLIDNATAVNPTKQSSSTLDSVTKEKIENVTKASAEPTQNCTNSTADTVIPNNQEALDSLLLKHKNTTMNSNDISKNSKQRALSQEPCSVSISNEKSNTAVKIKQKQVSMSDTEIKRIKKNPAFKKGDKSKNKVLSNKIKKSNKNDLANLQTTENEKETTNNNDHFDCSAQTSQVNPCLQSVSLYDEHFNLDNYINSSDNEGKLKEANKKKNVTVENKESNQNRNHRQSVANNENKNTTTDVNKNHINHETKIKRNKMEDVVLLHSHSESDSDKISPKPSVGKAVPKLKKMKRSNALDKLFGFSSGAVITKRKMCTSRKMSSHQCNRLSSSLESSEWTSETDSEYDSTPRSRKRRHADKSIKPKSLRIRALEEDGGLFVMYRNKIYPLVKDGKKMKRYLLHNSESDPEEDNNFWKEKYEKEKKRVAELKRLVDDYSREKSPLLPSKFERNPSVPRPLNVSPKPSPKKICENHTEPVVEQQKANNTSTDKTVKITFAKNNQEVHLEGHWSQLHPVLADVVDIFHKDIALDQRAPQTTVDQPVQYANPTSSAHQPQSQKRPRSEEPQRQSLTLPLPPLVVDLEGEKSSTTTPVDPVVREKIMQMESKIFKEIEEREQQEKDNEDEEKNADKEKNEDIVANNVTKRKRQVPTDTTEPDDAVRRSPSPRTSSSPKRLKASLEAEDIEATSKLEAATDGATDGTSSSSVTPKKRTRTPKKKPEPKETTSESKPEIKTKKSKKSLLNAIEPAEEDDDDAVTLYKFPDSRNVAHSTRTRTNRRHLNANQPKISSSLNNSQNSESNQGYVDSDVSPVKLLPKRRRRLSLSTATKKHKAYQRTKRNSCPTIIGDLSSDSNTSLHIVIKHHSNDRSLQSSLYRSESYQLLVPHKKHSFSALDKITEECSLAKHETDIRQRLQSPISVCSEDILEVSKNKMHNDIVSHGQSSFGNSSSVSLPPSPELSIVENLSVSKELVNSINNFPTINEMRENETGEHIIEDKYLISKIDVSMPLMQQHCGIKTKCLEVPQYDISMNESNKCGVTESLLNKIETVNITGGTSLSDSLNHRIQNLLLESAKKMSDLPKDKNDNNNNAATKKARNSKRCSTPHKKNQKKKGKPLNIDPVVEEEHMETCSYGGRKSCPPSIEIIDYDRIVNNNKLTAPENGDRDVPKENKKRTTRGRVKKDIIKVKISKPKVKSKQKVKVPKESEKPFKNQSACGDSGINITESATSSNSNNSIDLIHNHSETCLQVNECLENSVELIETTKSIISINSDSSEIVALDIFEDCKDIVTEILSNNAKDFTDALLNADPGILKIESPTETQYHSPIASETSMNSLITEDLSDDIMQTCPQSPPSPSWFLLGDEDNTNTNMTSQIPQSNCSSFGANLKQIFPITCAIPDLSTITEMSKENDDNSRKPFSDFSACDTNTNEF